MKKRSISAEVSGPLASVYEPLASPPDQAWPAPCRVQVSVQGRPPLAWCTVRV